MKKLNKNQKWLYKKIMELGKNKKVVEMSYDDLFRVFNGNRNQFRKRIDITCEAFAKFAVDKPEARMYLHMGLKDQGWDIMPLFSREMRKQGLDPNGRIIMTTNTQDPPNVEVDMLNTIYNACDVGVNTCKGEGWGLVNFEHAACKVAQVVPNHTSCKEIFEGKSFDIREMDAASNRGVDDIRQLKKEIYQSPLEWIFLYWKYLPFHPSFQAFQ